MCKCWTSKFFPKCALIQSIYHDHLNRSGISSGPRHLAHFTMPSHHLSIPRLLPCVPSSFSLSLAWYLPACLHLQILAAPPTSPSQHPPLATMRSFFFLTFLSVVIALSPFADPRRPTHLTISASPACYLMLPPKGRLVPGHCCLVPTDHLPSIRQVRMHVGDQIGVCVCVCVCACVCVLCCVVCVCVCVCCVVCVCDVVLACCQLC